MRKKNEEGKRASCLDGMARHLRRCLSLPLLLVVFMAQLVQASSASYGNYVDDSLLLHLNDRAYAFKDYPNDSAYEAAFARYQHRLRELKVSRERYYASYLFLVSYYIENNHFYKASSTALHVMSEISKLRLEGCNSVGYALMGRVYSSRGDIQEGIRMMDKAVESDPRTDPTLTSYLLLEASRISAPSQPRKSLTYAVKALNYSQTHTRRLYNFVAAAVSAFYCDDRRLYERMQDSVDTYHRLYPQERQLWHGTYEPLMAVCRAYFEEGPRQAIGVMETLPSRVYDINIAIRLYREANDSVKLDKALRQQSELRDSLHGIAYNDYLAGINRDHDLFMRQQAADSRHLVVVLTTVIITMLVILLAAVWFFVHVRRQPPVPSVSSESVTAYKRRSGRAYGGSRLKALPSATGEGERMPKATEVDELLYRRIIQFITANKLYLHSDLQRDDILNELHISKNKFSEVFRKYGHTTFLRYVNQLRMEYALTLLRDYPGYTIEAVALESGINPKNFYSAFSQKYGLTPTEYKRRVQKEREAEERSDGAEAES